MEIPTIKVKRKEDGVECLINEVDFDSALHTKVGAKAATPEIDVEDVPAPEKKSVFKKTTKK